METRRRASRIVYENRWMRVREDTVRHPDGSGGIFGVVEKPDFALIIPLAEDGGLWVVEQFRYPVGARFIEFPQGSWEDRPGVGPAILARAELREETGLQAESLRHLGHLYEAYGYSNQRFGIWLATGLQEGEASPSSEEGGLKAHKVTRREWETMLRAGRVKDAPSVAAYGLLLLAEAAASDPADTPLRGATSGNSGRDWARPLSSS